MFQFHKNKDLYVCGGPQSHCCKTRTELLVAWRGWWGWLCLDGLWVGKDLLDTLCENYFNLFSL